MEKTGTIKKGNGSQPDYWTKKKENELNADFDFIPGGSSLVVQKSTSFPPDFIQLSATFGQNR